MRPFRIPPMVTGIVQTALSAVDGVEFSVLARCPFCGGTGLSAHDIRTRQFAILLEKEEEQVVRVHVKRYYCRTCGCLCYADEPFYPRTRIGSPVIDLCRIFSASLPYGRVARVLSAMGVVVDRWSVRNYALQVPGTIPATSVMGIPIPSSILSLSGVVARSGERGRVMGTEVLAACGFPAAHRAALHAPSPTKQGDKRDEQDGNKKREANKPEHRT